MKRDNWPVGDHGIRPAGSPNQCLYCKQERGSQHLPECVIRKKTVVVRAVVEYVITEVESWDKDMIEFHRGESTWCASNGLREMGRLADKEGIADPCSFVRYEYVREATEEDEEQFLTRVREIPS